MVREAIVASLGMWADDPRSVAGAIALEGMPEVGQMAAPTVKTSGHDRDSLVPDLDPRSVAARNAMAYRHSPMGHLEAVANPTRVVRRMTSGQEYSMR